MEARASIKNVPVAPRKARLVADLIRDRFVEDALNQLAFIHKSTSATIRKLIQSAVANAQHQDSTIDSSNLFIKRIFVDEGLTRKWIRPRARGMANRILRRRCHITVVLDEERDES
ncbi:MAG: 50S ribosomal protein L22 [Candidatus Poribacteria bacterium]|nr:50S ribosomal protein L22 [Candidatus Poribacteria bacterium]MDE0504645.1 50S ribosomal protein L22 [Candidatus Poribacteria bacterium]